MEINKVDITVIIPMYNSKRTIKQTLESICKQTKKEYINEILVVNDGSTDSSDEIVMDYAKTSDLPIRLINKENGGVSSARNTGIHLSQGRWIAFCDSDDIWLEDKIEKQVNILNKYGMDLLGGNHTREPLKILCKTITDLHKANVKELCLKMYPQTSTIIMKKVIAEKIGGFDEKQKYAEDGNFFIRVAAEYEYYYMPDQVVVFDSGRRGFGVSGLSGNLKGMHEGNLKNIREFYRNNYISTIFYILLFVFYELKYFRRILLSKNW